MSSKKLAIICTKGTLDWAYPPFILSSTAAAMGFETRIFFTFYGLQLLRRRLDLKVSPLGNPAMPMPFPVPVWLQGLPGMESVMTMMMKNKIKSKNVPSIEELRALCIESGVKLIGCQMTIDLFDFKHNDFIEEVEYAGAATFLEFAGQADTSLFI